MKDVDTIRRHWREHDSRDFRVNEAAALDAARRTERCWHCGNDNALTPAEAKLRSACKSCRARDAYEKAAGL